VKSRTLCLIAAAQLLATAAAQAPGDAAANHPATEAKLHSLQLLLTETIFTRQPLTPAEAGQPKGGAPGNAGSSGDRPFAIVRDAMFEPTGKLTSLIVDAPSTDGGRGGGSRTLPAKSVQWDDATKRWLVGEMSLQFAELPEFKNPDPAPPKEPATTPAQRPVMASELLNASGAGLSTGANEAIQTKEKGGTKARIVWWMSPVNQQLAFAVVSQGEKFLAVPWAALRTSGSGEQLEVRLQAAPTAMDGAPTVASAMEQPSAAVRQAAYRHYAVDVPKWDRAAPAPAKDTEPKPPAERTPPPPPLPQPQPQPQPPKYER
jgi:hypothetical protein